MVLKLIAIAIGSFFAFQTLQFKSTETQKKELAQAVQEEKLNESR